MTDLDAAAVVARSGVHTGGQAERRPGVELVIFDLDGTVVDSEPVAVAAFATAFRLVGGSGPAPVRAFRELAGLPIERIFEQLGLPPAMVAAYRAECRRRVGEVRCIPGMEFLLASLSRRNVPMAILTGKDRPRTEELLHWLGIAGYFAAVVTPDDVTRPKPAPDGVYLLCRAVGTTPQRTVLVGDAPADVRAGRAAGARTVACLWGAGDDAALAAERPDSRVSTVAGLMQELLNDLAGEETRLDGCDGGPSSGCSLPG